MDDSEKLDRILAMVDDLTKTLAAYRDLLPEPGSLKGRVARRRIAAQLMEEADGR